MATKNTIISNVINSTPPSKKFQDSKKKKKMPGGLVLNSAHRGFKISGFVIEIEIKVIFIYNQYLENQSHVNT